MKKSVLIVLVLLALAVAPALASTPPGAVTVQSNPLWTYTGVNVRAGQQVRITVPGSEKWDWGVGSPFAVSGYMPWNQPATWDRFLYVANHGEMIGYVGDDPYQGQWGSYYYDWFGEGDSRSGGNQLPGYLRVGTPAVTPNGFTWTADHDGMIWLGFNDDAVSYGTGDNAGYAYAYIYLDGQLVTSPPPNSVTVTANPLWTSTGVVLSPGEHVHVVVPGPQNWSWGGGETEGIAGYQPWSKPNTWDRFLYVANHGEMIAYVGADPYQGQWGNYYYDWFGEGDPRSGGNQLPGYLRVGTDAVTPNGFNWTADHGGLLWLGFNDDSASEAIGDNSGYVYAFVYVNHKPVAKAGASQMIHWGDLVQLNGTGSQDADGDPLTYSWEIVARPAGSAAALDNPHSATPSFSADALGTYRVKLTVSDPYQTSDPDYVVVDTSDTAPIANAGPDQSVPVGPGGTAVVTLNGSASSDPDGDPIASYTWTWSGGSASGATPQVTLPVGVHVITLVVSDGVLDSPPATLSVQANRPPVAVAGDNIEAEAGPSRTAVVGLDGSGSYDPDGDALTYAWTWNGGSASGPKPSVELPQGWTNVRLVVSDGYASSQPAVVNVFVKGLTTTVAAPAPGIIQEAIDAAHDWDTIVIGPGTYTGCITLRGKQVTLISRDGANRTIIQGDQSIFGCPLITCDQNETPATIIDGFTLQGQVAYKGTGIYIHNCSPTVRNCVIHECVADDRDDVAPAGAGGAMWVDGTLGRPDISNCLIYNNTATSRYGCGGIYVCCGADATITSCTLADNFSNFGPGALNIKAASTVLLRDCVIWGNSPHQVEASPEAAFSVANCDIADDLWPGTGNLSAVPQFVAGALGDYYLGADTPCRDAGSGPATAAANLAARTTQADGTHDSGRLDCGYHYPVTPVFIRAVQPANSHGVVQPGFGSGEQVFIKVDYAVQGKAAERFNVVVRAKIGPKKFTKKMGLQAPGNYTALVRCKGYTATHSVTKKAVASATLKSGATVLAQDKLPVRFAVQP